MKKHGILSLSLSMMLGGSLLYGCAPYPASVSQPTNNQFNSNDPYISQAQLAMASYQEVDASFADSQTIASQNFATQQVDGAANADTSMNTTTTLENTNVGTSTGTTVSGSADVNGDGFIDSTDAAATATANAAANAAASTSAKATTDVNGDGVVDDNDIDTSLIGQVGGNLNTGVNTGSGLNQPNIISGIDTSLNSGLGVDITNGVNTTTGMAQAATQLSSQIDTMMTTQISSLNTYGSSIDLFNRASAGFSNQILAAEGVELDSAGKLSINTNRLMADIRADLRGDAELMNTSLDMNGQLNGTANSNLRLNQLSVLGYSGTSSNVLAQANADGTTSEHVLFNFKNLDADVQNRVRVTSNMRGQVTNELNLRLDSLAKGFTRTGLREISRDSNGNTQLTSEVSMKLHNGSQIDMSEKRFVNANGSGTGFGTFNIVTASGQTYSGSMRTVAAADGKLMMIFEPTDTNYGRLMLQETSSAQANLALYNSQGNLAGTTQFDLEAALDAMTETKA